MEDFKIAGETKGERYSELLAQIRFLVENEPDLIARMANVSAMIHDTFNFWWTGFYRVEGDMLVLGPFQGPLACTRIGYGKGVCGSAWKLRKTLIVHDVDDFPGHIACSSFSKSEIVVPIFSGDEIIAVIDIDSDFKNCFDQTDAENLEKIARMMAPRC